MRQAQQLRAIEPKLQVGARLQQRVQRAQERDVAQSFASMTVSAA
jgi:hypothetical protein